MKVLFTVKAVVTRWLSHGAACKRCVERYVVIIEALDNVLTETEKQKPEVEGYHATLLQPNTIMQIALLDDVLSTTSALCLLLQSDKKDFGAVNGAVNFTVSRLETMIADKNADIFDSLKKSSNLYRVNCFNKQPLISFQTRKRSLIDTENEVNYFHHKTAIPFLKALIKEIRDAFNLDNLPVLLAITALDLHGTPSKEDDSFDSHGNDKIETLFNFYGKTQGDVYDGHRTSSPALLLCTHKLLKMEYGGYKNYVAQLKINFKQKLNKLKLRQVYYKLQLRNTKIAVLSQNLKKRR